MSKKPKGIIKVFPSPLKIKYKDIFDLKEFYKALHDWLLEYSWGDYEEGKDHWETFYGERIGQGGAKEIWILWRLKKKAQDAPLTYYLDISYHVLGLTNTEVVKEGIKMKVNKGEVELEINGFIGKDYEKSLSNEKVIKGISKYFNINKWFTERVYHSTIEERKKELYQEIYVLQNFIKQWFKLKRYLPYEEVKAYHKSYAWPSHLKE